MRRRILLGLMFLLQALCALFFVSDILSALLGLPLPPLPWELRELMEVSAALGLLAGLALGGLTLWRAMQGRARAEERLRRASAAFMDLLQERFAEWGLTAAERDVALFAIKGLSTAEIAAVRQTSEGTVKAQTAAIYRKAGVSGRPQLLSLFIEDLMREDSPVKAPLALPPADAAVSAAAAALPAPEARG
ncbi:helix-turn-helix transcriptional regulator [Neotabrizicola sp. VNH66]|uniref:helix-turn-helix transcriptional regulator n=1 Tax=Neotabrizicola sp. VNH66 TaxID=3400918 RepID=UPI003BFDEA60